MNLNEYVKQVSLEDFDWEFRHQEACAIHPVFLVQKAGYITNASNAMQIFIEKDRLILRDTAVVAVKEN